MGQNQFLKDHYGPGYRVWLEACDGSTGSCTKEQRSIIKDWRGAVDKTWKMAYPVHRNFRHYAYDVPPEVSQQNNKVELAKRHRQEIYKIKEVKSVRHGVEPGYIYGVLADAIIHFTGSRIYGW